MHIEGDCQIEIPSFPDQIFGLVCTLTAVLISEKVPARGPLTKYASVLHPELKAVTCWCISGSTSNLDDRFC
jgi:hypothetical protein